jgi:hypothetical protein
MVVLLLQITDYPGYTNAQGWGAGAQGGQGTPNLLCGAQQKTKTSLHNVNLHCRQLYDL